MNSEISTYTISVYELQEYKFDFGLNDYPIFDEAYRPILNKAILDYYMFREIGYTNPAVWRQRLQQKMSLIMRNKYNALYKAKQMDFNPLYTMELYEDYQHTTTNTGQSSNNGEINYNTNSANNTNSSESTNASSNGTTNTTSDGLGLSSQFPSEEMTENDLTSSLFVDSANKNKGSENVSDTNSQTSSINGSSSTSSSGSDKTVNSSNGTSNNTSTETFSKKTIGSASDLTFAHAMTQFKDYCDQFQIDQMIIDELKDLFIQVW